jgi:mRNA-degrading endonuclease RelE of RelBE toxin-antitoxin system
VSEYTSVYEQKFVDNLRRYAAMRQRIKQRIDRVLDNPYHNTELLADASGKLDLRGCRSVRIDRNFRVIFVICEECRNIPACEFCFCDNLPDKTVVFLTVGPHERAYDMR